MNRFRKRQLQMLVATDVAARGLDVTELTHVINYNLPDDPGYISTDPEGQGAQVRPGNR